MPKETRAVPLSRSGLCREAPTPRGTQTVLRTPAIQRNETPGCPSILYTGASSCRGVALGFLGAVFRQGGDGAEAAAQLERLEWSWRSPKLSGRIQCSAYSTLHSTAKKSNRVIVSSFPEPKLWECCWQGILFQPDFALSGAAQTAHLQETGYWNPEF